MTAPTKSWIILPTTTSTTFATLNNLAKYATVDAAREACLKAAISTGTQYQVLEAVEYCEPTIPTATVTSLTLPIT